MDSFHPTYERLQRVMTRRGVKAVDLYRTLKISKQNFSHWKQRGVPDKYLLSIAEHLRCNAKWIATGRGDMLEYGPPPPIHDASIKPLDDEALYIARAFMAAPPEMRRAWRLIAEDYFSRLSAREKKAFERATKEDAERYSGIVDLSPAGSG